MKTTVPAYYRKFHCIASDCRHNCCREGWEIDLDDAHVELYRKLASAEEPEQTVPLLSGLVLPTVKERRNGAVPHIRLRENGICPFLNEKGLCILILKYGEKSLCQICADHPRFRNFYRDHMEMGLGLCCEEAGRLILNDIETGSYENLHTGAKMIPMHQNTVFAGKMQELEKATLDFNGWAEYFLGLELLEKEWKEILENFMHTEPDPSAGSCALNAAWKSRTDNLTEYFLYRYGCSEGIGFASFSARMIRELAERSGIFTSETGAEQFTEICRLYSSEIEYSEENRKAVAARLRQEGYGND